MNPITRRTLVSLAVAALTLPAGAFAQGFGDVPGAEIVDVADTAQARFSMEQIEQMVAPVALYPDAVLAQVLMAATYPLEVAQAAQWRRSRQKLEGEALDDALRYQPWDESVKTLVLFPEVLDLMADDLAWTQDLGDAFLGQEGDVMAAVQELRRRAEEAGNLASNDQQIVRRTGSTIIVEPADPAVIYVPSYNPTVVYGPGFTTVTRTTYYPTVYRRYESTSSWLGFGAGVVVGALLTAVIDWADDDDYYVIHRHHPRRHHHHLWYHGPSYWSRDWSGPRYGHPGWRDYRPTYLSYGDVSIDRSRTINIERNTVIQNNDLAVRQWQHAPAHRGSVRYRDPKVAERIGKTQPAGFARPPGDRPAEAPQRLPRETLGDGLGALPAPGDRPQGQGPRGDAPATPRWSSPPDQRLRGEGGRQADSPFQRREPRGLPEERPAGGFGAPERARDVERAQRREGSFRAPSQPQDEQPRWSRRLGADVNAQPPRRAEVPQPGQPEAAPAPPSLRLDPQRMREEARRYQRAIEAPPRSPGEAAPRVESPRGSPFGGWSRPQPSPESMRVPRQETMPQRPEPRVEPQRSNPFAGRGRPQAMPEPIRAVPQPTAPRLQESHPEPNRRQGLPVPERRPPEPQAQRAQPPSPPPGAQPAPPPRSQGGGQAREEGRRNPFKIDRNE
jgi:hypothetical protein